MTKHRLILSMLLSIVAFLLPAAVEAAAAPPALRVSANGRFLVRPDGSPFFPVADTAWAIAWRLDRRKVEEYLKRRRAQEFNTIALVAFPSYQDGEVTPNAYGDQPFVLREGRYDPLRPIVTPGNDPADSEAYDYWDHLEYIIDAAAANGMYVIMLPAWGGHVAGAYGTGKETPGIIIRLPQAYRYGHWIGGRFKNKRNLLWMLGGDRSAVYGEHDYRNVFRTLAEGIADGVNGIDRPDGKADFSTTLMSYHPQKWQPNSSAWFHNDPWLDFNSIQDQPKDQIVSIEFDYGLVPAKPTWLFEGGYEHRANVYTDWQIRFQSYQTVFAGGFGITYGNMNIFHFTDRKAPSKGKALPAAVLKWEDSLDDPGGLQMRHLAHLMTSLGDKRFLDRIPDQSLIVGDPGTMAVGEGVKSNRIQATRGRKGDYAMIYSANGRLIRLRMNRLSKLRFDAFWYNPRNGKWRVGDRENREPTPFRKAIPGGPEAPDQEFDPPGEPADGNDWVLVLRAEK